jgi:hypothetical protein
MLPIIPWCFMSSLNNTDDDVLYGSRRNSKHHFYRLTFTSCHFARLFFEFIFGKAVSSPFQGTVCQQQPPYSSEVRAAGAILN